MNMTGMDKDIFRATRRLTTLLNEACNHWNYLCPYLEKLDGAANRALEGYQKDYPNDVDTIIAEDRKSAIRPRRNCDVGTAEEQAKRFWGYCNAHSCNECPARGGWRTVYTDGTSFKMIQCGILWAQMPYEANEKGEVDDSNG